MNMMGKRIMTPPQVTTFLKLTFKIISEPDESETI